jgi:MoaA/NifB/PqqE/SkfB family radical SAM enzyme
MSDEYRIDSHKLMLHPQRVSQWLEGRDDWESAKRIFPVYVEVSPVGFCNHACTFCGVDYMLDRPDKTMLDVDLFKSILSDMAAHGVRSVMFAGAGEPLIYKRLAEIIRHADSVGLDTSITTNGVLMTEEFCREAFQARRLRWIKVSINGGTAPIYEILHQAKPGDFEKVMANLATAVRIRRELGQGPTLGGQMVALPEIEKTDPQLPATQRGTSLPVIGGKYPSNFETAANLAKLTRSAGIDYLVIKPYSQHPMSEKTRAYEGVTYRQPAWAEDAKREATETFKVVVRYQTMAHWDATQRGYDFCRATPHFWAYLEADGNVWGCSAYLGRTDPKSGQSFGDDRFCYGNVQQQPFSEIWQGEKRRLNWDYVRKSPADGGLDISECRKNCRMHSVNLYLHELANPGPHDTFI